METDKQAAAVLEFIKYTLCSFLLCWSFANNQMEIKGKVEGNNGLPSLSNNHDCKQKLLHNWKKNLLEIVWKFD